MRLIAAVSMLVAVSGCETPGLRGGAPIVSIDQIDEDVATASRHLGTTVEALARLLDSKGADLSMNYNRFRAELITLDAFVYPLRDRATAVPPRRTEYLIHWLEQTSTPQSPDPREQVVARQEQLMPEFIKIGGKGQDLKSTFASVHASMHDCERVMGNDLTEATAKSLAGELVRIREGARQVEIAATDYRGALTGLKAKLKVPLDRKK